MFKPFQERFFPLNSRVHDNAYLFRIENLPRLLVVGIIKRYNVFNVNKVDEGVTTVTLVLKVDGEVKEVNLVRSMTSTLKFTQQRLLLVSIYSRKGGSIHTEEMYVHKQPVNASQLDWTTRQEDTGE